MNLSFKALFLAALSFTSSTFCIDADIFKEMLTLSTSVEAQEKPVKKDVDNACVWLAAIKCREQIRAYRNASQDNCHVQIAEMEKCIKSMPCAQDLKK